MHSPHGPQPTSPAVFVLALTLASCVPARAPEEPAPRVPATQMTAEALLGELNPRGGAALVQAWHREDPEAVAAFYSRSRTSSAGPPARSCRSSTSVSPARHSATSTPSISTVTPPRVRG